MRVSASLVCVVLLLLLFLVSVISFCLGAVSFSIDELLGAVRSLFSTDQEEITSIPSLILLRIRLPRFALAAVVGAGLAISGAVFQGIFRNGLAEPYLLGVSSGAALGATIAIVIGGGIIGGNIGLVGLCAFAGSMGAVAVVYLIVGKRSFGELLIGGLALSYVLQAAISVLMMFHRESLPKILFWTMGSFTTANWDKVLMLTLVVFFGGGFLILKADELNLLSLGEEQAHSLGIHPGKAGGILLLVACLITSVAIAVSGIIGFVGLMVPHLMRLITGSDNRRLLPVSLLGGALLMTLADLGARTFLIPKEIPVGAITALLGGPFFLALLLRSRGSVSGGA